MGMCCEKMMMIGWRNAWSMKLRVQEQEEDQRGPGERLSERIVKHVKWTEDAMERCKWRKMIKDVRWSGWVWVFLLVPAYLGCPGQKPLNGCVCIYFNLVKLKHTYPDRQISFIVNIHTHANARTHMHTHTQTHNRLMALCLALLHAWASTGRNLHPFTPILTNHCNSRNYNIAVLRVPTVVWRWATASYVTRRALRWC